MLSKRTYSDYKLLHKPKLLQYSEFYTACKNGDLEDLKYSLKVVDTEYTIDIGFWHACKGGHLEIVELLLSYGARWFYGKPLFKACQGGNMEIVKIVVSKLKNNDWSLGYMERVVEVI
jgi:hypothetical protein